MVFDPGPWKHWEGRSVDGAFPLMRCLGGTARGAVFETQFQSQAAVIKLVPGSPESLVVCLASWETAATLSHPNLVPILARGEAELGDMRCAYLVTELADENLAEVLAERPLTPVETREMLLPVLSALRYLHAKGFAHGNLKPSNVLAFDAQVKISTDSVVAGADATGDCHAIGALVERALGGGDPSSVLPDPFAEISRICLNPDPRLRLDIPRIEASLRSNPAQALSRRARTRWWGLGAIALVIVGLVAIRTRPDAGTEIKAPRDAGPTPSPAKHAPDDGSAKKTLAKSAMESTANEANRSIEPRVSTLDGITQVLPKIPQAALNTINGRVRINVRVWIDGAGNVSKAILDPPPASKYFTDRALAAAQAWRFPKGNVSQEWVLHFELLRDQTRVSPVLVPTR